MLTGETETKENFKYLSKHGIRTIGALYLSRERDLDDLVAQVPEDVLTGFQLRDILESTKKYNEIKKKLYECIMFNKRFPKSIATHFTETKEESKEEKKEKEENGPNPKINFDLAKFFTDAGAPECINKL